MPFVHPSFNDVAYELATPKPKPFVKKMPNPKTMSPVVVANAIRAAATPGTGVTRASLVSFVNANTVLSYGANGAAYEKEKPGLYMVSLFLEGTMVDQIPVTSTSEAKMLVIEHLVNCAVEDIAKEKQNA